MGPARSARLAVLASLSLALTSGTILRAHSSVFQMRKMASSGTRFEYVDGQTRSGLHQRAGRMLKDKHALAVTWIESAAEADDMPAVMRTNLLPLESLPSPAASILALHQAPISWTRRNGAAVGQLMLAALLVIGAEQAPATQRAASTESPSPSAAAKDPAATTFVSNVAAQHPGAELQQRPGGDLQTEFPTRWGFAEPSYDAEVAVLQQTIDEQSQQIKTLEAAVEALRAFCCIVAGLVVVIL